MILTNTVNELYNEYTIETQTALTYDHPEQNKWQSVLAKQIGPIVGNRDNSSGNDFGNMLSCVHAVLHVGINKHDSFVGGRRNNRGIPK